MSQVLAGVNQRTRLVGHNRLELLLFRLDDTQLYGINVFKVREVVMPCPALTRYQGRHPANLGITRLRGTTISVIDLQVALGRPPLREGTSTALVVAEFSRSVQGFLVASVDRIINTNWEDILPAPVGMGDAHFLTAVTKVEGVLVEILDVEKVLFGVAGIKDTQANHPNSPETSKAKDYHVLVVDDSAVARKQIERAIQPTGVGYTLAKDGREALDTLLRWAASDAPELERLCLIISDVEMPRMDGYTFTKEVRKHQRLQHLYVLLHTSLSGVLDSGLLEQVQANKFLAKYDGSELSKVVYERVAAMSAPI
ncbi:MAG: chemotaxis protein [Gammaproteobacteria bacterium]|nr:chemotaxis protein [Gammaproteobacteria bacterium]